jgi:Ca-activated chloride channel family protein
MHKIFLILAFCLIVASIGLAQTKPDAPPLTYGLVLDHSGSMRDILKYVNASAANILNANELGDQSFILRFISSDKIETIQELTQDKMELTNSLKGLHVEGGETAVIDGVYLAAEHLVEKTSSTHRALVVITDGDDRASYYKLNFLSSYLQKNKIPVYILAYVHSVKTEKGSKRYEKALALINTLANESGGKVVIADKAEELPDKAAEIIRLLRS